MKLKVIKSFSRLTNMPVSHIKKELFCSCLDSVAYTHTVHILDIEFGYETSVFGGWVLWYRNLFLCGYTVENQEDNRYIDTYLSISKNPVLIFTCISSLYGIRLLIISTCDPEIGVAFWVLIPSISFFAMGACLGEFDWKVYRIPNPDDVAVLFLELIWVLFRLAFEPPIQVYEWFWLVCRISL